MEGGKDNAGNKSFQYIDVTIPEIYSDGLDSVGREMTFGLLWPEGATSSRGETPIRVEVLQKDLSPDSEEYHDVTDISKSGIGFDCKKKLEINSYYDAKIQIWTKEVVDAVIQIVRSEEKPDGFHYGGVFIGMTDTDALKIDIYQIFNEL